VTVSHTHTFHLRSRTRGHSDTQAPGISWLQKPPGAGAMGSQPIRHFPWPTEIAWWQPLQHSRHVAKTSQKKSFSRHAISSPRYTRSESRFSPSGGLNTKWPIRMSSSRCRDTIAEMQKLFPAKTPQPDVHNGLRLQKYREKLIQCSHKCIEKWS
jgi:hypothetical protein